MSQLILSTQTTAPSAPSTGKVSVYVDSNSDLSWKDAAGNITKIAAAGSYTLTIPATGTAALYAGTTWSPVLKFGTTTVTGVTINSANYATIGNMLFFQCDIVLTGKNGSGAATIQGLPVAAASAGIWAASVGYFGPMAGNIDMIGAYVVNGTTTITLVKSAASTTTTTLADTDFSTTTELVVTGFYRTA